MVRVSTTARSGTAKQASSSSTTTPSAPTTAAKPTGTSTHRSDTFDDVIRREAMGLLRKHKRMTVTELYSIINIRYTGVTRRDVNTIITLLGFEGSIVVYQEPVAILKETGRASFFSLLFSS